MKLVFGFVLLLVASSTVSPAAAAALAVKNPGVFINETISAPSALDPATNYESFGSGLNELLYETLIDYAGNSATELEGILATDWVVSADGLQYNFTLRQGVKFHDGTTFNAYVMKYSLDRMVIMNDHWGPAWMIQQVVEGGPAIMPLSDVNITEALAFVTGNGFKVIDEYEFQINLEAAYTPFIYALVYRVGAAVSPNSVATNAPSVYTTDGDSVYGQLDLNAWFPGVTDDAVLRGYLGLPDAWDLKNSGVVPSSPADADNEHDWMIDHDAGSGPYYLVDVDPGTLIELAKFTGWWNAANFAEHSVDRVLVKTINEVATRILDLKGGDADSVYIPSTHAGEVLDLTDNTVLPSLAGDMDVYFPKSFSISFFGLNLNDTLPSQFIAEDGDSGYNASAWNRMADASYGTAADNPFSALRFREAIALAFDYATFMDAITNGFSERLEGVIPNGMFGHHDTLLEEGFLPVFDPDTANAYFQAVNWTGDLTIGFNTGNEVRRQGALLLATTINDMLIDEGTEDERPLGINVNVLEMAWPTYLRAVRGKQLPIFFLGWAPDYADPDNYVAPFYHGNYGTYAKRINYNNSAVNTLIENAAVEQNATAREIMYWDLEELAAQDTAFIYVYQVSPFRIRRNWVTGYEESGSLNPMSSMDNYQYINKYQAEVTTTTTTTTTVADTTTTTEDDGTPGFEFAAIFVAISFVAIYARKRRR